MVLPYIQENVLDPGLGLVEPAENTPLVTGTASAGATNTLFSFSRLSDIRGSIGYGPGPEDVAKMLQERGGPVYYMRPAASVAAVSPTTTTETPAGSGPTVGLSGTANETFTGIIRITAGGTLGVGRFKFTLDAHDSTGVVSPTWSQEYTIPAGGSFVLSNSGLTASFPAGTYVVDTDYTFTSTVAGQNPTDIGGIATALLALPSIQFPYWDHAQSFSSATDASAMAAAISGHLTSLAGQHRYARAFVDAGSGATSSVVTTEAANWTSRRIAPQYGFALVQSALPYEGFSVRKSSCRSVVAARASRVLPSTDLARFAEGPLEGVLAISFDHYLDQTLDGVKIGGLRTHPTVPGFYVSKARLKSPAGSDFTDVHLGRIMDIACRTVYEAVLPFLSESLRTTSAGTLDPKDGKVIEKAVNAALSARLLQPLDARGLPGYVSACRYTVDLTNAFATTKTVQGQVGIRPKQSADFITTNLGFTLNV